MDIIIDPERKINIVLQDEMQYSKWSKKIKAILYENDLAFYVGGKS